MNPCVPSADVLRGCRERVDAVRREREVPATEGINEVRTLERRGRLLRRIVGVEEGPAGEETDRLCYGGLEKATVPRVRAAVRGESLAKGEEGGEPSETL